MIRADDSIRNVLVVMGYRNSNLIDYQNPPVRWMYYLAAAGHHRHAAGLPKNQILESPLHLRRFVCL